MPHTDFDSRLSIFFRIVFVSFFSFTIVKIPFVEGERKVFLISQTLFSISHFEASVKHWSTQLSRLTLRLILLKLLDQLSKYWSLIRKVKLKTMLETGSRVICIKFHSIKRKWLRQRVHREYEVEITYYEWKMHWGSHFSFVAAAWYGRKINSHQTPPSARNQQRENVSIQWKIIKYINK